MKGDRCHGRRMGTRNKARGGPAAVGRKSAGFIAAAGLRPETGGTCSDETGKGQIRAIGRSDLRSTDVKRPAVGSADNNGGQNPQG